MTGGGSLPVRQLHKVPIVCQDRVNVRLVHRLLLRRSLVNLAHSGKLLLEVDLPIGLFNQFFQQEVTVLLPSRKHEWQFLDKEMVV